VDEGNLIEVTYDPSELDMVQRGWGIDYATPIMVSLAAIGLSALAVAAVRSLVTGRPVSFSSRRRWPVKPPVEPGRPRTLLKRKKVKRRR
jgi:hypothetical protein